MNGQSYPPNQKIRLNELVKEIVFSHSDKCEVQKRLINPDKLIVQTKAHLETTGNKRYSSKETFLSINVTKRNLPRAFRFMNGLIGLLKARGHSVICKNYYTNVRIGAIDIEIALREVNKRIPSKDPYSTSDYIPTGKFALKTNRWSREKEWKDGRVILEERLPEIVARLELDAEYEVELQKQIEQQRREREIEFAAVQKANLLKQQETQKMNDLISDAEHYQKAQIIREFINAKENRVKKSNLYNEDFVQWIIWARKKADSIDPLTESINR